MTTETRIGPIRLSPRTRVSSGASAPRANESATRAPTEAQIEEDITRIRAIRWNDAPDREDLMRWASCPDERVRLALLRSQVVWTEAWLRHGRDLCHRLALVAVQDLEEGELWNPTLNALAGLAWDQLPLGSLDEPSGPTEPGREPALEDLPDLIRRSADPSEELARWIGGKVAPELRKRGLSFDEVVEILQFTTFRPLRDAAISAFPFPDLSFARWLIESRPRGLPALAARDDLPPDVSAEIWQGVLDSCTIDFSTLPAADVVTSLRGRGALPCDALSQLFDLATKPSTRLTANLVDAIMTLLWADEFGNLTRETVFRTLASLIRATPDLVQRMIASPAGPSNGPVKTKRTRILARGLAEVDPVLLDRFTQEQLRELEPEDWLPALKTNRSRNVVARTIVKIPAALSHPAARDFVFRYGEKLEVLRLLEEQPPSGPEELRAAARAVLRAVRSDIGEVLQRWPELKAAIEPADLAPLLASGDGLMRQEAILLLGEIDSRSSSEAPIRRSSSDLCREP